jgi:4,5-DOPA dioxygenase extradiol
MNREGTAFNQTMETTTDRMSAVYLGHGAPPLVDDEVWVAQLRRWAADLPKPKAILVVSAHWESAPLTLGATRDAAPLTYDFYGFPQRYYEVTYPAPGAPELARRVAASMADTETVAEQPDRGLDHGAYVPLTVMYPDADIPCCRCRCPTSTRSICSKSDAGSSRCVTRAC